jgi:hypothetical protein
MWTLPSAINTSLRAIQDTIYNDYRRMGDGHPSYMNPSRSGLGFTDRTGRLRSSISYDTQISTNKIIGTLSSGVEYDVYVEMLWGGKYSFMLPALIQNKQKIYNNIINSVTKAINRIR